MSNLIENYAMVGNGRSAALVGTDGSIDWLCLPSFSDAACFAALLGSHANGCWAIAPVGDFSVSRGYRGDTMVLETTFTTADGSVATLVDFMPRPPDGNDCPDLDLVRIVRGVKGTVRLRSDLALRFNYGKSHPWVRQVDPTTMTATAGAEAVVVRAGVPLRGGDDRADGRTLADVSVTAGGPDVAFVMTYYPSHRDTPPARDAAELERQTAEHWSAWAARWPAGHPYREAVMRSLLTLKALAYEPTGGIVAAPTTSLPEEMGGIKNWDYRYTWIRDAALTLYALASAGYSAEVDAWRHWLLRAAAGRASEVQILYGIRGERHLPDFKADWLEGYGGSTPVHVGNAASTQFQLDVYGELMSALHLARVHTGKSNDGDAWTLQREMMDYVEQNWHKPDKSLWEVRGPARHFTQSKVMAWVAVDRCIRAVEQFKLDGPVDHWRKLRDEIRAQVHAKGFNPKMNSFTQYYGGTTLDAALLTIPQTGFMPATDPRFVGTLAAVEKQLMGPGGFLLRYLPDEAVVGMSGGECAFLPCSFWLASAYHLSGRTGDARALFDKLLAVRNDVGLLSEEYDGKRGHLMGNFPQAFTHVALIATANLLGGNEGVDGTGPGRLSPAAQQGEA